jgi:sarcosine oxidase subunit beta
VPSRWLTPAEAAEIVPAVVTDDLVGATFCPLDGYATPEAAVQGYAQGAARLGARIVQGCEATRIAVDGGRLTGVETVRGRIAADRVVLTAGVWSKALGRTAGVDIPVEPEERRVWFTGPGDGMRRELPLTIDFATSFYFHREGDGLLFGGREATLDELGPVAAARLPVLAELEIRGGWSGLYEVSPDHNAIVGRFAEPDGLVYATGFSGHGFQQGPVVGEHLAELALDLEPTFDLTAFSVERFARGELKPERNVI